MAIPINQQELLDRTNNASTALYAQIVARIRQWVKEGNLKEGDLLPSERELADVFDVSRVPVREALKTLEFLGVVQHIRGKGVIVKRITLNHVLNNIEFLMFDPLSTLHDLFEVRESIEVQAAGLAAVRRTKEDLDEMENALIETELQILRDRDINDASLRFHTALITAAHNNISLKINELLLDIQRYSRQETLKNRKQQMASLRSHRRIFDAVKDEDVEVAKKAMLEHLREVAAAIPKRT
jgi:GntR family transcriptional regulator, transcriptional repressor for pyruvate dehydrogenase complex